MILYMQLFKYISECKNYFKKIILDDIEIKYCN